MSSWRNSSPLHQNQLQSSPMVTQPQHLNTGSNNNNSTALENGPRAKCDQVVFEAIAKAAEIVVGSRCWIDHIPTGGASPSSSSRRFNLLVPEVQGVRSILQRWKRALHVPLRLDVYFQHPDSRRELLERWCLEYAPKTSTHHPDTGSSNAGFNVAAQQPSDPIVQLRQVCKQIVIWLRSLYCWSRMLPAQALRSQNTQNNAIGFSIYVVSEGNDDVSGLVSQQGFSSQGHPHSVWTPYGELGWKVFYAPNTVVQRLIPETPPYSHHQSYNQNTMTENTHHHNMSRTQSQPIPMRPQEQQQHQQQVQAVQSFHPRRDMIRRDSTPATTTARSAPQNTGRIIYHRSKSDVSDVQGHAMSVVATAGAGGLHSNGTRPQTLSSSPYQQSFQQYSNSPSNTTTTRDGMASSPSNPPPKNMSGLSLAMMTLSDNDDSNHNSTTTMTSEAAEKRRAALHHAPPQMPQSSPTFHRNKAPLASAGEYGYAYNNHIPLMRSNNHPNSNSTPPSSNHPYAMSSLLSAVPSSTPIPLGSTPPGYLLGGPTPPPSNNWSNLIPPRGAVTPPFTRPMGFIVEPPSQSLTPPAIAYSNSGIGMVAASLDHQEHEHQYSHGGSQVAPTTLLDLLHSSPFRQPIYGSHYFGSSMVGAAADPFASMGSVGGDHGTLFSSSPSSSGMKLRMMNTVTLHPRLQEDPDADDSMPFAVDGMMDENPVDASLRGSSAANNPNNTSSSTLILREMIQPPKRLQLFQNPNADGGVCMNDSQSMAHDALDFADQLADFRSFGASLTVSSSHQSVGGSGEVETAY